MGSRFVLRGLTFNVEGSKPLKANTIWLGLDDDLTVQFSIQGAVLNFNNRDARSFSIWANLKTLPSFKILRGDAVLSPEEANHIPVVRNRALFRVALFPRSTTHMMYHLLVCPLGSYTMKKKAKNWGIPMNSAKFPAVDLTYHWR